MSTDQIDHPIEAKEATPASPRRLRSRFSRRGSRFRWATLGLVVVAMLGLAATSCTNEEIATFAVNNHFAPAQRDCAMRIVKRESNYDPAALSSNWLNIGLFQINHVHADWIQRTYGYEFKDLFDADKNAQVARGLSDLALRYYGDRWQPWRYGGQVIPGGGCPA